jgi:hypothetical protein
MVVGKYPEELLFPRIRQLKFTDELSASLTFAYKTFFTPNFIYKK